MGKRILFVVLLLVLIFALSGVSYAWQGRMGGMGDPYGLVADESDYLIHPAKIANGEGVRFYGDYRFTYTGVTKWTDHSSVPFVSVANISGAEIGNNALIGAAFPLWLGRMGLFFTYDGMRGNYSGWNTLFPADVALENNLDNFAVRLMYGLPVGGGFKVGAEAQLAYRHELVRTTMFSPTELEVNGPIGFFSYPFPNDSRFLEALFKGSMEGKVGPVDVELTLRGGLDLPGTNSSEWNLQAQSPPGTPIDGLKANGEVHAWQVGGDLWLRYALASDLTLPFLVRADYLQKSRSGFGPAFGGPTSGGFQDELRDLTITIGGGLDKAFGKETRIAAGIYYNFLQGKEDFTEILAGGPVIMRVDVTYPDSMEHQLLLRLVGEHVLSPMVTLRAGLNLFYGWVIPEAKLAESQSPPSFEIFPEGAGHGYDWGFALSVGGTVVLKPLTFEPFVGGGYRQLHLGLGDAKGYFGPPLTFVGSAPGDTISRNEWLVDAGLSILFDL